ncbi:MAG: hydrogenase formation protein HypD [Nitrospirae bacterium]|nr:hydrogenase formation protein HypD [Nitrospirota bacterium]
MSSIDYLKDFRNPQRISDISKLINRDIDRRINIMEICGGHTHTIMRYGLQRLLPIEINFIHGPGCPVCVMPKERIDQAIALAQGERNIVVTLGDLIRVPGSISSLQKERAKGKNIAVVYSPFDTISIAHQNKDKNIIFIAIGFETTTPMTASLIERVLSNKIKNVFFHINHVMVPPPIKAIMIGAKIDAFIGPSHVSVIAGAKIYQELVTNYKTPVVVTGFEPVDVLDGVYRIVKQFKETKAEVEIQYNRAVTWEGNKTAQGLIDKYLDIKESVRWRGIGDIPKSGYCLKKEFSQIDAEIVFKEMLSYEPIDDHKLCICGDILRGIKKPFDCTVFGNACKPDSPIGACMVSNEGACSAYYKYYKGSALDPQRDSSL